MRAWCWILFALLCHAQSPGDSQLLWIRARIVSSNFSVPEPTLLLRTACGRPAEITLILRDAAVRAAIPQVRAQPGDEIEFRGTTRTFKDRPRMVTVDAIEARLPAAPSDPCPDPAVAIWNDVRRALLGPQGPQFFEDNLRGSQLPLFHGVAATVRCSETQCLLTIQLADSPAPEITLLATSPSTRAAFV